MTGLWSGVTGLCLACAWPVPGLCLACAWISLDFVRFRLDFVEFQWISLDFKKGTLNDPQPN